MRYPLFKVAINSESSLERLRQVFESGYVNEGSEVAEFQSKLVARLGTNNLVLMNSCTSALTVAYKLSGVGPGREVISSPMTCIATNTPVINLGGTIVWCDIDPASGNIDPSKIESLITDKTSAIVYVDWAGNPAELEQIQQIGIRHGVKVIQDAAHAFGANWRGESIANFADFTCFSFQAIKHLSCGDGGALVCKAQGDFVLAKKLKWFGYDRDSVKDEKGDWKGQRWDADIHESEVGYKFNMNNISAAIGLAGLEDIDEVLARHRKNAKVYADEFAKSQLIQPLRIPTFGESSFWAYTVILNFENVSDGEWSMRARRDMVVEQLNELGVGAGLIHLPNDIYAAFQDISRELPGTRKFEGSQLSLPCGWWLSESDARLIANLTIEIVEKVNSLK
jgi:dTDP-4-amino-4,6-dideoxygalactose transaminase